MLNINKEELPVDPESMKAEIDCMKTGIVVICEGRPVMYPIPKFGKIEISFQNYKNSRPHYDIVAE